MNARRAAIMALILLLILGIGLWGLRLTEQKRFGPGEVVTVGFIYNNDESTPYSHNFLMAQEAAQSRFQGNMKVMMFSNIMEDQIQAPLNALIENHCDIVFTNTYGDVRALAKQHPDIHFCQVSNFPYPEAEVLPNYHTHKGEIYQGRYVTGVVAGLKLRQLIDAGQLRAEEARVGYVAAYPYPEVISGYTAFILGVRSVAPEARMTVRYIHTWSSYTREKQCADRLLDEGCVIIAQHSDTVGPAVACEAYMGHPAFHVGYNMDMRDVAPNTSLVSTRINWTPYVTGAIRALLEGRTIEETVEGRVHPGNDMSAGLDREWVIVTPVNAAILPEGAQEVVDRTIEEIKSGTISVFSGDYIGVHPENPDDWIDLHDGFIENAHSSIPSFDYILQDVVTVEA